MARPTRSSLCCVLALALAGAACGERPAAKKSDVTSADVIAGSATSFDHFVSAEGKFAVDFPSVWQGNYIAIPHSQGTQGSHFLLDFRLKPDPTWKVDPQTLLVIRIFTPAAWAKVTAQPGAPSGVRILERGGDVYVLSLAAVNPYGTGTAAAQLFDKMMLAVVNDPTPLRVTPR